MNSIPPEKRRRTVHARLEFGGRTAPNALLGDVPLAVQVVVQQANILFASGSGSGSGSG